MCQSGSSSPIGAEHRPRHGWITITSTTTVTGIAKLLNSGTWIQIRYDRRLVAFEAEKRKAKENNTEFTTKAPGPPVGTAELYNGMIAPLVGTGFKGSCGIRAKATRATLNAPGNITRFFQD